MQVDILEHKETQLKGTERRVHTFEQQVEQLQSEMGRYRCRTDQGFWRIS